MKFLDIDGLTTLWNKIKSSFLSLEGGGTIDTRDSSVNIMNSLTPGDSISLDGRYITIYDGDNKIQFGTDKSYIVDEVQDYIQVNGQAYADALTTEELNEVLV